MTRRRKILITIFGVVVALVFFPLLILATVFASNFSEYRTRAATAKANAELRMFRNVLLVYAADHDGRYPDQLNQLVPDYLSHFDKDPWGNPYAYFLPGTRDSDECVVISFGPDRVSETADDLDSRTAADMESVQ